MHSRFNNLEREVNRLIFSLDKSISRPSGALEDLHDLIAKCQNFEQLVNGSPNFDRYFKPKELASFGPKKLNSNNLGQNRSSLTANGQK